MSLRKTWGAAALCALVLGCGPTKGDGPGDGVDGGQLPAGSLVIQPGDVTLAISNGTPATQSYTAIYVDDDGNQTDVTADTTFSLGLPALGTFSGGTLTTAPDRAGRTIVNAIYQSYSARANLTITLEHVIVVGGAPSDAPDKFDGAGSGGVAPTLVYPSSGVILPPNLNTLEFHFLPGAGNTVFELELIGSLVSLKLYITCQTLGQGCYYAPDEAVWELIATAGRGEDAIFYTLRGIDGNATSPVAGESATHSMMFAADDMLGGIYYWNASGSIMRYEFGRRGQSAETYLNVTQTNGTTCVGCHALSREGSRIAVGLDIPGPAGVQAFEVATRSSLWSEGGSTPGSGGANFFTFSPDNSKIITSDGASMVLRDAATGANPQTVIANGTMADWSPANNEVVFARPGTSCPLPGFCAAPGIGSGSIVAVDASDWTTERNLVPASGDNNYYPAFSPDGEWIIFNKSSLDDSYDAADAAVYVVHRSGGTPIRLSNASPPPGGDSWPKWAPFVQNYKGGKIMWLTFSSRRDYGLRLVNSSSSEPRAQIWMVGFDPAQALAGNDPSFTAFWLPFQDIASGNHIAQWVEEIDRQPCGPNECPTGEFCEEGVCVPVID
jgi:hypothetical protein